MNYFKFEKRPNFRKLALLNTLCLHNTCGLIKKSQCPNKLSCCHKAFTFPTDGLLSTTTTLKFTFYSNSEVNDINNTSFQSSLVMAWDRVLKVIDLHYNTARSYHPWKHNNVHKHMITYHSINKLLLTLWSMKEIKHYLGNSGEMNNYCDYVSSSRE